MAGTRTNAVVGEVIDLFYQFTLNSRPYDAFSVDKVEIYPTQVDAEAETNRILEILPPDIEHIILPEGTLGKYMVTVPAISVAGVYFDKWHITPKSGYEVFKDIEQFYVRAEEWGGGPEEIPRKCLVYGYVDKMFAEDEDINVKIKLNKSSKYNDEVSIIAKSKTIKTDENGFWQEELIVNNPYMPDDAYYDIQIGDLKYKKIVGDVASSNVYDLDDYEE